MYREIPGGTKLVLKHGYEVWLPPKPTTSSISGFDLKKKDQKFIKTVLPEYWTERRLEEEYKRAEYYKKVEAQVIDPRKTKPFVDKVLEQFRRQEWRRRDNGYWFFLNGVPTYITGAHYYYLTWTRWDHEDNDGYPIFYDNQLHRFYFRQLCAEDPRCLGYIVIGPRGFGKSTEEISCILERMTNGARKKKAALQSKTEDDAQDTLFIEKLVPAFNELPDFFKPVNDHGTSPVSELSFKRQRVTGKEAKNVTFDPELELLNRIYWAGPGEEELDGGTFYEIMNDEIGKTKPHVADVKRRIAVNRKSVHRNNRKVGLIRACTTVEEMEKGGAKCIEAWDDSNPEERTDNGMTLSGLYKWFVSIRESDSSFADEFGIVDPERPMYHEESDQTISLDDFHKNARKALEHNPADLADWIRKHPIDESDIRVKKSTDATFNSMRINNYKIELQTYTKSTLWVRGNFNWTGKPFESRVEFERDDHSGRWQVSLVLDKGEDNKVKRDNDPRTGKEIMIPANKHKFCAGTDPIKDVKTKNPRASKMSTHIFYKYDDSVDRGKEKEDWLSHRVIARYNHRPEDPNDAHEDTAKALIYYGTWSNIEGNVTNFTTWLKDHGMEKFKMTAYDFDDQSYETKKSKEDSLQSTPEVQQAYINKIRGFIKNHFHRVNACPFIETIEQLQDFEIEQVTFFDDVVSLGYCLLGDDAIALEEVEQDFNQNDWFDEFDIDDDKPVFFDTEEHQAWEQLTTNK